jgi:hypothetical protein
MTNPTSNQVEKTSNNPNGIGGFGDHPENRSDGRWSKETSFTYWINFFKTLSVAELRTYMEGKDEADINTAEWIAYSRILKAKKHLDEFKEVANRTEGMPIKKHEVSGGVTLEHLTKEEAEEVDEFLSDIRKPNKKEKGSE